MLTMMLVFLVFNQIVIRLQDSSNRIVIQLLIVMELLGLRQSG
jgi:hypothetical protein